LDLDEQHFVAHTNGSPERPIGWNDVHPTVDQFGLSNVDTNGSALDHLPEDFTYLLRLPVRARS
jgi:hypothetical protein